MNQCQCNQRRKCHINIKFINIKNENDRKHTGILSGKHLWKKFGLGLPTASLMESVITPVIMLANKRPKHTKLSKLFQCDTTMFPN